MPGNTIGHIFRLTTFGESHGDSTGGIIDGCPAGLALDLSLIGLDIDRRRPVYPGGTARQEPETVEWMSGIRDGITLGTPIAFRVRNAGMSSADYEALSDVYRPSHADFTYQSKYGIRDHRGGGRASGRETLSRVIAGAVARQLLSRWGISVAAEVSGIGPIKSEGPAGAFTDRPDVVSLIHNAALSGDSLGGEISCRVSGVPAGLGEPVFDKLQSALAAAIMSIGTARGFEFGLGFKAASMSGAQHNDPFILSEGKISTLANNDGGIQGGISNGEDIFFRAGFKPVPSIAMPQQTVDSQGKLRTIEIHGRHDACHLPRLVVVVEAMTALVMADYCLMSRLSRLDQS
jgi:chorismate synthase